MKNFKLLLSTSRFNEYNAKAEAWYALLVCGDKYPIVANMEYLGLITLSTYLDSKEVIECIKKVLQVNPDFFKFILKIVPIDFVCESNIEVMSELVHKNYRNYIKPEESFRIVLKRRKHKTLSRENIITKIAKKIKNPVDLEHPQKILRIEVLGNFCGITFHNPDEIIRLRKKEKVDK